MSIQTVIYIYIILQWTNMHTQQICYTEFLILCTVIFISFKILITFSSWDEQLGLFIFLFLYMPFSSL